MKCRDCRWFKRYSGAFDRGIIKGECRRDLPRVSQHSKWPVIESDDWCAYFEQGKDGIKGKEWQGTKKVDTQKRR